MGSMTAPMEWADLLPIEKGILFVLYLWHEHQPCQLWNLYVNGAFAMTLLPDSDVKFAKKLKTVKEKIGATLGWSMINEYRKAGLTVPSFPKFKRILIGMKALGWINERVIDGAVYYSIDDKMKEQIEPYVFTMVKKYPWGKELLL